MAEKPVVTQGALKRNEVARPLHIQRLEAALDIRPFIYHMENELNHDDGSDSASDSDGKSTENEMSKGDRLVHGVVTTREERRSDRLRLFNFSSVGQEREWLRRTLLSSSGSSDSSDENEDSPAAKDKYIKSMLKEHVLHKSYASKYYGNPDNARYMYYGSGLLSTADRYPEKAGARPSVARGRRGRPSERGARGPHRMRRPRQREAGQPACGEGGTEVDGAEWEDRLRFMKEEVENDGYRGYDYNSKAAARARKKAAAAKSPEALTARRRRHWQLMAKKELGKVQRARTAAHRDLALHRKRLAALCCKHWRHRAMQSQKNMKETIWRCKRLTREMQAYWRRYDRAERETRRRMEREAEEQRKMDVELMEAKRQRRKLNFLITQTELYAHFMQRKLGQGRGAADGYLVGDGETDAILRQLEEDRDPRLAAIDHYDSELMKEKASHNAREALRVEQARAMQLDAGSGGADGSETAPHGDHPQPLIFQGTLKGYQLKGMNWLANLYDQGISGILADEMGLGKTVQCIAFLCHVAERLGVWGPFLVVSPASTLHNWQQEMERFVPEFKVVPYWGSPSERKILRQFWERKDLHTRTAAFHVVVTSYQIVVSDLKYLNRVAWQYMILDEAQAIKSSASLRWKLLLGFSCRNRLLLSGTPIQNSMAELWALLHFIMPTLFDSHDEFNEWFSKDIESHAENKTTIDEKHLSRLHMILKPFMLRRIKKDVENELSDKIEIMVHCPLTIRQKLLYIALKKKIKIEELLHYSVGGETGHSVDKNFTSNLMNLVMQFRKVCNHPELFERRDVKSSFAMSCDDYYVPKLVAEDGILLRSVPSKRHLLYNKLSLFAKEYVHRQLFDEREACADGLFSFTRFMDLSPSEVYGITLCGWLFVLHHLQHSRERYEKLRHRQLWWRRWRPSPSPVKLEPGEDCNAGPEYEGACGAVGSQNLLLVCPGGDVLQERAENSGLWSDFLFTRPVWPKVGGVTYTHNTHTIHYMVETAEHKAIRARALVPRTAARGGGLDEGLAIKSELIKTEDIKTEPSESTTPLPELAEFPHVEGAPVTRECEPTALPLFLYYPTIKVQSTSRRLYAPSRAAQYANIRHEHCDSAESWQTMMQLMDNAAHPAGWSNLVVPDKNQLVSDAGKLTVLDSLLRRLKERGHRVLIYSQMTKMIDLLEEYMWHRKHKYMRLDGSSKISARRDMVADFQARSDIFVFLLSTRAGGLGINLTAADTVIFYDSDWNPTVDQQAMDRAHRLGQTKQVTVYRLICKGTIEERIMQRAREKSEIQRMVISGGNFKPDTLKPKEVVSLLLDDEEIELKYRQGSEERPMMDESPRIPMDKERKRKLGFINKATDSKRPREAPPAPLDTTAASSGAASGTESGPASPAVVMDDDTSSEALVVDVDSPAGGGTQPVSFPSPYGSGLGAPRLSRRGSGRPGARRGRPRGSRHAASARRALEAGAAAPHAHSAAAAVAAGAALLESDEPLDSVPAGATPAPGPRVRRGPGRPRLRGGVAPVRRSSGTRRPRRPREPLFVPLGVVPARAAPARPG